VAHLLLSPWANEFDSLVTQAGFSLVLCSLYIGQGPCDRIKYTARTKSWGSSFNLTILTDLSRDNMLSGVTDVAALASVAEVVPSMTIRFLPTGPATAVELHTAVQKIHPDLCDDAVDRVIDGKHSGKKWKHAVRTAQQHLKKTGQIQLIEGRWQIARSF